jgi:hypothetical protein
MRIIVTALLALGLVATALATTASAQTLLSESFTYPDGGLVPNGGWATHSGTGTDIQVASGVAAGNMANGPDDNRLLSSARLATDKTYACFRVLIPTPTLPLVCNYFAHFMVNSTTFRSKVFVTPSGSTFTFGLSVTANAAGAPLAPPAPPLGATWGTALNYDQWYSVVISYNGVGGVSELWVDPVDETSTSISCTDAGAANGALTAFGLRESNTSSCAYLWNVDNLGVGTTFLDACDPAVPTIKSTWGQLKSIYRN